MLWGGIKLDMRTELVVIRRRRNQGLTGDRYVNEVLNPHVRTVAERMGEEILLAHDNARLIFLGENKIFLPNTTSTFWNGIPAIRTLIQ
ncbi:hypothetical protein ANN_01072 [Periplaneta americana]|uniref:Uncharacterized protein n=1 Tax=Periplaneta americana TaxID=6978 RepID=A0ABQ8TSJ8_PERAM|nr:hypothetical protein ANN_01072 [Periplaneta americana]